MGRIAPDHPISIPGPILCSFASLFVGFSAFARRDLHLSHPCVGWSALPSSPGVFASLVGIKEKSCLMVWLVGSGY